MEIIEVRATLRCCSKWLDVLVLPKEEVIKSDWIMTSTIVSIFEHASQCDESDCQLYGSDCRDTKQLIRHLVQCSVANCMVCIDLKEIIHQHAFCCQREACPVYSCNAIRMLLEYSQDLRSNSDDRSLLDSLKNNYPVELPEASAKGSTALTRGKAIYRCGKCRMPKNRQHVCHQHRQQEKQQDKEKQQQRLQLPTVIEIMRNSESTTATANSAVTDTISRDTSEDHLRKGKVSSFEDDSTKPPISPLCLNGTIALPCKSQLPKTPVAAYSPGRQQTTKSGRRSIKARSNSITTTAAASRAAANTTAAVADNSAVNSPPRSFPRSASGFSDSDESITSGSKRRSCDGSSSTIDGNNSAKRRLQQQSQRFLMPLNRSNSLMSDASDDPLQRSDEDNLPLDQFECLDEEELDVLTDSIAQSLASAAVLQEANVISNSVPNSPIKPAIAWQQQQHATAVSVGRMMPYPLQMDVPQTQQMNLISDPSSGILLTQDLQEPAQHHYSPQQHARRILHQHFLQQQHQQYHPHPRSPHHHHYHPQQQLHQQQHQQQHRHHHNQHHHSQQVPHIAHYSDEEEEEVFRLLEDISSRVL